MELEKIRAFSQKYLPSKKFTYLIGGVILFVVAVILVSNYVGYHRIFNAKPPISADGTLGDVVGRDSNGNGIPDWEESLYGLDPTGDGASNKAIIDKKQAAADVTPGNDDGTSTTTATDAFSQQLLSTIIALQQSGTLTPQAISQVAASVGDSVDTKHSPSNTYSMSDITLSKLSPDAAKAAYYTALKGVVSQYDDVDLGSETSILADGLGDGGASALQALLPIASAYTQMGKQIIALPTPPAVAQNALELANSSIEMGDALTQAANIYTDVLSGMVGIDDYTKASALSDAATDTLSSYFGN